MGLAIGPYSGKEDGQKTALLRGLLDSLEDRDVVVADRFYCSFMMLALLLARGVDGCVRMHQHRPRRLPTRATAGPSMIIWSSGKSRNVRSGWTKRRTPRSPTCSLLREIHFQVTEPGRRVRSMTIATTLLDPDEYSKEDIAELYGFRWQFGTRHPLDQADSRLGPCSLQVAVDGSQGVVDGRCWPTT